MASVNSRETIAGLVHLQALDADVYRIRRRLTEGPELVKRRGEKSRLAGAKLVADREKIRKYRASLTQLETELQSKEAEVQKIKDQQQSARTNQEYRALDEHVQRIQNIAKDIEDRILEGFSKLEAAEAETESYARQVVELEKEQKSFEKQWATDQAGYETELAKFEAQRAEAASKLPKDAVTIYERVLKARDGEGVIAAEGRVCGGCQMNLLPNDLARLHSGEELVTCNTCQRILYLPGVHGRG